MYCKVECTKSTKRLRRASQRVGSKDVYFFGNSKRNVLVNNIVLRKPRPVPLLFRLPSQIRFLLQNQWPVSYTHLTLPTKLEV